MVTKEGLSGLISQAAVGEFTYAAPAWSLTSNNPREDR